MMLWRVQDTVVAVCMSRKIRAQPLRFYVTRRSWIHIGAGTMVALLHFASLGYDLYTEKEFLLTAKNLGKNKDTDIGQWTEYSRQICVVIAQLNFSQILLILIK